MIIRKAVLSLLFKPQNMPYCRVLINRSFVSLNNVIRYKKLYTETFKFPYLLDYDYKTSWSKVVKGSHKDTAAIISKLKFKCDEDALPFYQLPLRTLIHIQKVTEADEAKGFCTNRLYYISDRIKCSPSVLSEKLAKRTFIYGLSFDWTKNSLDVLLEMGVSGERIVRDLWVLKYHHETIRARLQRVKEMGVTSFYPWMVRCSEDVLNRSIMIKLETKNILGENKSTHLYLAERLNTTIDTVEEMCLKNPSLKTVRVTKLEPAANDAILASVSHPFYKMRWVPKARKEYVKELILTETRKINRTEIQKSEALDNVKGDIKKSKDESYYMFLEDSDSLLQVPKTQDLLAALLT